MAGHNTEWLLDLSNARKLAYKWLGLSASQVTERSIENGAILIQPNL